MSKQATIGYMYIMHICLIFMHVPAEISNSRDSAVVYITYLLSYVFAVHNPEETYVLCHCARPFIFIA